MPEQRYTNPIALQRMAEGNCPECGQPEKLHGGWGLGSCSLTDTGVAARINQFEIDRADQT